MMRIQTPHGVDLRSDAGLWNLVAKDSYLSIVNGKKSLLCVTYFIDA